MESVDITEVCEQVCLCILYREHENSLEFIGISWSLWESVRLYLVLTERRELEIYLNWLKYMKQTYPCILYSENEDSLNSTGIGTILWKM